MFHFTHHLSHIFANKFFYICKWLWHNIFFLSESIFRLHWRFLSICDRHLAQKDKIIINCEQEYNVSIKYRNTNKQANKEDEKKKYKFNAINFGRNRFVISLVFTKIKKAKATTTTLINLDEIALCAGLGVDWKQTYGKIA